MNGVILLAFCVALPANELVVPVILMAISDSGNLFAAQDPGILIDAGWTWKTALCTMVFTLFHWPCSTTLLTIYKETKSVKWLLLSFLLPTALGIIICAFFNLVFTFLQYIV
jgi:ferrous iron transport protein B